MRLLLLLLSLPLFSCTTVEHADGSRETRFDAAGAAEVVRLGVDTYDRAQRIRYPDRYTLPPQYPYGGYPPVVPIP